MWWVLQWLQLAFQMHIVATINCWTKKNPKLTYKSACQVITWFDCLNAQNSTNLLSCNSAAFFVDVSLQTCQPLYLSWCLYRDGYELKQVSQACLGPYLPSSMSVICVKRWHCVHIHMMSQAMCRLTTAERQCFGSHWHQCPSLLQHMSLVDCAGGSFMYRILLAVTHVTVGSKFLYISAASEMSMAVFSHRTAGTRPSNVTAFEFVENTKDT